MFNAFASRRSVFFLMLTLLVCLSAPAAAEQSDDILMEEMVVSAESEDAPAESLSSVQVLTREEIEALPIQSFQDLLDMESGITTYSPQGMGIVTPPSVRMRGTSGVRRILVVVDGIPWNNPWTGYWYFSEIPVEAIERVEIIYGPYAARYGMYAGGGVIKITTRDGSDAETMTTRFAAETGDFGRTSLIEQVSLAGEDASLFVSHRYYESSNWRLNNDDYDADDLARTGVNINLGHFHGRYGNDEASWHLVGGLFENDTEYGVSSVSKLDQDNEIRMGYLGLSGDRRIDTDLRFDFGLSFLHERHFYRGEITTAGTTLTMAPAENDTHMWRLYGYFNGEYLLDDHTLTFGVEAQTSTADKATTDLTTGANAVIYTENTDHPRPQESTYSAYVQDNWLLDDGAWEIILGCRFDYYDLLNDGGGFSPKGSVIWHYDEHGRVRFSAGQAYLAPTLSERYSPLWALTAYGTFGINVGAVLMEGNPDLDAETQRSVELSLENEFPEYNLTTRLTPFYTYTDRYIESGRFRTINLGAGRTASVSRNTNRDAARVGGVEAVAEYDPFACLHLFGNYQWQDAHLEDGQVMDNFPDNMVKLGATYREHFLDNLLNLTAGTAVKYLGRYRTETSGGTVLYVTGFTNVDANLALGFWEDRIELYAECYNLFDVRTNVEDADNWLAERNYVTGLRVGFEF